MIWRACAWTAAEVAEATGGVLAGDGDRRLSGVSTDTRDALADALFVALSGEKYDAHDFLDKAIAGGAGALLIHRTAVQQITSIQVTDTLYALGQLGAYHRKRMGTPMLALTGSNGKTTTKEMIAAIFGASRKVLKTEGNLNNLIGVPMTLLGLTEEHQVAVVEMGMNTTGEIARYTQIARPEVGLVLNVGPAHIGFLGSLDAVGNAKGELYFGLDRDHGIAVINADDPQVMRVANAAGVKRRRTFGKSESADVRLVSYEVTLEGGRARYLVDGTGLELELSIAGEHNAMNAAGAIAATTVRDAAYAPATLEEIARGLKNASWAARRMTFEPIGSWLVVDDCYNANSASMLAALETVRARAARDGKRFVAVLGEMRELGTYAAEEHKRVGEAAADAGASFIAAFGKEAAPIAEAARARGIDAHHEADDAGALWSFIATHLRAGDVVLVKGSRGMKMERFIEKMGEGAK